MRVAGSVLAAQVERDEAFKCPLARPVDTCAGNGGAALVVHPMEAQSSYQQKPRLLGMQQSCRKTRRQLCANCLAKHQAFAATRGSDLQRARSDAGRILTTRDVRDL